MNGNIALGEKPQNLLYELFDHSKIIFETPNDGHSYFFGYYDKCPFDASDSLLLAHRTDFDGRPVNDTDIAEVGYFDIDSGHFHKIGQSKSFNWQQGSHLQWLPPDYRSRIIYNDRRNGQFVSVIYCINTGKEKVYQYPVYAVHPSGNFALAVNYERLYFCRPGYNYMGIDNKEWKAPIHEEDGIYRVDFETRETDLLIRTHDIVNFAPIPEIESCDNWLEHMMWNPTGDRFLFFHRWRKRHKYESRFFTSDVKGNNIFMYPDVRFYSHYYWVNDKELIVWTLDPNQRSNKLRNNKILSKYLEYAGPFYQTLKTLIDPRGVVKRTIMSSSKLLKYSDQTYNYRIIGNDILTGNGHTSYHESNYYINDTYQDENCYRYLQLFDDDHSDLRIIGKFYSNYNDNIYRCDLHHRSSNKPNKIVIDSAHNLKRSMLVIWCFYGR